MEGAHRFLKRLWVFGHDNQVVISEANKGEPPELEGAPQSLQDMRREFYELLRQADFDFGKYQFNTVVAACMKMLNLLTTRQETDDARLPALQAEGLGILLRLLAPVAPHISHILWQALGYGDDILRAKWPQVDEAALVKETIELVVQVNGKLRGKIEVSADADKETVEQSALADGNVQRFIEDKTIRKIIVVPGRLVNVVAN